jgi:hypothetical protein
MVEEQLKYIDPFPEFPSPNDPAEYPWVELRIGTSNSGIFDNAPAVEDFWSVVVQKFKTIRNVDIHTPEDEAWFHLRRYIHANTEQREKDYAVGQIEILRLKKNFMPDAIKEEIRCIPSNYPYVVGASWWGAEFKPPHDNPFLSFLQKLSVLRAVESIIHPECLAYISDSYDKCPFCEEAYQIMMSPNQPWSVPLAPWFEYFTSSNLASDQTHEYAHWFGHILSGWS